MKLVTRKDSDKYKFKEKFIERFSALTDWEEFKRYSLAYLNKSIRINTIKCDVETTYKEIKEKGFELTPIPWCKEGFWITSERTDIGNLLEHTLGKIYVQEAASMIPPIVLDPKPGERVLDMCAAPGSKTTQMAAMMKNQGVLIGNDVSHSRLAALGINLQRCGVMNCVVTQMLGFKNELQFDKILVDAPCSGIGTIRKSPKTIEMWNPKYAAHMAKTQKRLAQKAFDMLAPGGAMVYSTCTVEPEEDEAIVDFILKNNPDARVEEINIDIKRSPAVVSFNGETYSDEVKKTLRIWPQDNDTEGFFVSKIRKIKTNNSKD